MYIPDGYRGREQAFVKHRLLRGYLEKLIMTVGHSRARRINFVDGFAGPWQDESASLGTTSIAISLDIMRGCRDKFIAMGRAVPEFRALYIERSRRSFTRLQGFLADAPAGIETHALHGAFIDQERRILDWCHPDDFTFFFIDPKGWKDVSMPKLRPLLERPNSEFLINLMYDFVNRAVSQEAFAGEMHDLFGEDVSRVVDLSASAKEREWELVRLYQRRLREAVPASGEQPLTSAVGILDPQRARTKYYLVYLTRHPKGIFEFVKQSEDVDIVQPHVRAQARRERDMARTGQQSLFATEVSLPVVGPTPQAPLGEVKAYWLRKLARQPRAFGLMDFAMMHEETGWFHRTLQEGLGELIAERYVCNVDAARKRPKNHVHFDDNERLVRLD